MLKKLFFSLCAGLTAQAAIGQIDQVKSIYEYQLMTAYSDEFSGSVIDPSLWKNWDSKQSRDIGRKGFTYADSACVVLGTSSSGENVLKLIAKKESIDGYGGWPNDTLTRFFYKTGMLTSVLFYKYGYYEVRVKKPKVRNTNGMAFWFWDADENTFYRELDVFETQPIFNHRYPMALHYSSVPQNTSYEYNIQTCTTVPVDLTEGWHTYGIDWSPEAITWYIDGVVVERRTFLEKLNENKEVIATVGTDKLKAMRLILNNSANYGIEASTTGDVMEVDYVRYYKRKPTISLSSYDATTGYYVYKAKTENPDDSFSWQYDPTKISNISTWADNGVQYIKFKRASLVKNIQLGITATQPLSLYISGAPLQYVSSSSTVIIGVDNPYFYLKKPFFSGSSMVLEAHAASENPDGQWSIGLKNNNGTVDWTNPQTQYGPQAMFTNLLSGKTYVIKHGVYGTNVPWNEMLREIDIKFNPHFYITYIEPPMTNSNTVNLGVTQESGNPDSEWHIGLVNSNGTIDNSIDQPQWGSFAEFENLLPGKNYKVTHGNYGVSQAWVESNKIIYVDFQSNFEFYNPDVFICSGSDPEVRISNGVLKLKAYSHRYPVTSSEYYGSSFTLYELDGNGNYDELDPPVFGPVYGKDVELEVNINKAYMVKHGVYTPNGYWTETRKTVFIYPDFVIPSQIVAPTTDEQKPDFQILDLEEINSSTIKVFPNPTDGLLHIRDIPSGYQTASVTDLSGRVVMSNLSLENKIVDFSQLPKGTYLLKLESTVHPFKVISISKQ